MSDGPGLGRAGTERCIAHFACVPAGFFRSMDPEGTGTAVMNLSEVRVQPSKVRLGNKGTTALV